MKATANIAGRTCPYCRFPVKEDTEVEVCPSCGAPHHAECWSDNQGCAITACASGPGSASAPPTDPQTQAMPLATVPPRTPRPSPPPVGYPPPGPPPRDRARNGVLFVSLAAVLVLGAALAFVIGQGNSHGTTTTELVKTAATNNGSDHTTPPTPPKESATTSSQGSGANTPSLTSYSGSNFSMMIPSGWVQDVHENQLGEEAESKWSNPSNSGEYILLDVHTPTHITMHEGAEPVRDQLAQAGRLHADLLRTRRPFAALRIVVVDLRNRRC